MTVFERVVSIIGDHRLRVIRTEGVPIDNWGCSCGHWEGGIVGDKTRDEKSDHSGHVALSVLALFKPEIIVALGEPEAAPLSRIFSSVDQARDYRYGLGGEVYVRFVSDWEETDLPEEN